MSRYELSIIIVYNSHTTRNSIPWSTYATSTGHPHPHTHTQTASSGRMSELLGSEAVRFIGFDSVSGGLSGSNQAEGIDGGGRIEDLLAAGSGSSFHVAMKQLGKRDPTTKLKVRCWGLYLTNLW